jgi:two-component system, sensor histidine kinase ChiS
VISEDAMKSPSLFSSNKSRRHLPLGLGALLFLVTWLGSVSVLAQVDANSLSSSPKNIRFKRVMGANQGDLTFSRINAMAQDKTGFIWFGTDYGVARYDGVNAVSYEHDASNSRSLSSNGIFAMFVDHENVLWVAADGGLNRFNRFSNDFDRFVYDPNNINSISDNKIVDIVETRTHHIYLASGKGISVLSPDRKTVTRLAHQQGVGNSLSSNTVTKVFEDAGGLIWIGTADLGLQKYDPVTGLFKSYRSNSKVTSSLSSNYVRGITQDKVGQIWVATESGLNRLNSDGETFTRYSFLDYPQGKASLDIVFSVLSDSKGELWVTLNQVGIALYDAVSDRFKFVPHDPSDSSTPIQGTVLFAFEDRIGDMWFPSFPTGVNYFNRASTVFKNYYYSSSDPKSLSNTVVSAVHQDSQGNLWVGTENGLNLFNPATDDFTRFVHSAADKQSLPANAVLSIAEDHDQQLWVGTWGGGVAIFDKTQNKFKPFPTDIKIPEGPSGAHIWALNKGSPGHMWIGTQTGGINLFDEKTREFSRYALFNRNDKKAVFDGFVYTLLEDSQSVLWAGTDSGLLQFNPGTQSNMSAKTLNEDLHDSADSSILDAKHIVSIYEDSYLGPGYGSLQPCTSSV